MTDLPSEPDVPDIAPGEAAVHAVLDGEATPEQRRMVARDPALRARLEGLRDVVAAVAATPSEPTAATYDAFRATALAALDAGEGGVEYGNGPGVDRDDVSHDSLAGGDATGRDTRDGDELDDDERDDDEVVVPLAARRRKLPPLPAVAAVVAVLLAIGVGLILTDRGGSEQVADRPTAAGDGAADAASRAPSGEAAESEVTDDRATSAPESDTEGGTAFDAAAGYAFADDSALRSALETVDPATLAGLESTLSDTGSETTRTAGPTAGVDYASDPEVQRCSESLEAYDPDIRPVQAAVPVIVAGERLLVLSNSVDATDDRPESIRLSVVPPTTCFPRFAVEHR